MPNINYHKMTLDIINDLQEKKKLLLHSCCAPCSSYCIDFLKDKFDITVFYYNPNICDYEEFEKRLNEQIRLLKEMNLAIDTIAPPFDQEEFYTPVKGYENLAEGGKRCYICYYLRMERAAKFAKENNYDFFTTTLSISPLKNANWINQIGWELEKKYSVKYLPADFKKNGGFQKSIVFSKKYNLYRQNFCGCIFSKKGG